MQPEPEVLKSQRKWYEIPKRYIVSLMLTLGATLGYFVRVAISVTAMPMMDEFGWTEMQKGTILSSFYWTYTAFQIPGGAIPTKFGGVYLFFNKCSFFFFNYSTPALGIGILATAFLSFLIPICSDYPWLIMALRIVMGAFQCIMLPTMHAMLSHWVPPQEFSFHTAFCWTSTGIGTALGDYFAGLIQDKYGWRSVYYVYGLLCLFWSILWFLFIKNKPNEDDSVSIDEMRVIQSVSEVVSNMDKASVDSMKLDEDKSDKPIPWLSFFTNKASMACIMGIFAYNWGYHMLVTYMPTYMQKMLNISTSTAAFVTMFPFLFLAVVNIVGGLFADWLLAKGVKRIYLRKSIFIISSLLSGVCLMGSTYTLDIYFCVILMTLSVGISSFSTIGVSPNIMEITPSFCGVLLGICNGIGGISGIVSPIITAAIIGDNPTQTEWHYVYIIPCVLYLISSILFGIWGSVEPQPALN